MIIRYGGEVSIYGSGRVSCLPETNRIGKFNNFIYNYCNYVIVCRFNECYYIFIHTWKVITI